MLTAEIATPAEQAADSNLLNLLIVDDERAVRASCREVAEALGSHTTIADSPEHCSRLLDSTNVDVVLLDLRLYAFFQVAFRRSKVARSMHYLGPFRDKPFIPGSGRGGTTFLDEVGELPIDLQAKLLRALQEKEIRPVGCTKAVPIHVRILQSVFGTNRTGEGPLHVAEQLAFDQVHGQGAASHGEESFVATRGQFMHQPGESGLAATSFTHQQYRHVVFGDEFKLIEHRKEICAVRREFKRFTLDHAYFLWAWRGGEYWLLVDGVRTAMSQ